MTKKIVKLNESVILHKQNKYLNDEYKILSSGSKIEAVKENEEEFLIEKDGFKGKTTIDTIDFI